LSKALNITTKAVSKCLHAMGKFHKEEIWLSHELSENAILNHLSIATSLFARQRKKEFFVAIIVSGDEKWIYFYNRKRKKSWVDP